MQASPKPLSPLTARALDVVERSGSLVSYVGVSRVPTEAVLIDGRGGTDWVVVDARQDPHVAQRSLGIPKPELDLLRRIRKSGTNFDVYLIGHELPPGSVARVRREAKGKPVTPAALSKAIGPPPKDIKAERAADLARGTSLFAAKSALVAGIASAAIVAAPLLALGALAGAMGGLDPVLFGAVTAKPDPAPGDLTAVFYLCHWTNPPPTTAD